MTITDVLHVILRVPTTVRPPIFTGKGLSIAAAARARPRLAAPRRRARSWRPPAATLTRGSILDGVFVMPARRPATRQRPGAGSRSGGAAQVWVKLAMEQQQQQQETCSHWWLMPPSVMPQRISAPHAAFPAMTGGLIGALVACAMPLRYLTRRPPHVRSHG